MKKKKSICLAPFKSFKIYTILLLIIRYEIITVMTLEQESLDNYLFSRLCMLYQLIYCHYFSGVLTVYPEEGESRRFILVPPLVAASTCSTVLKCFLLLLSLLTDIKLPNST